MPLPRYLRLLLSLLAVGTLTAEEAWTSLFDGKRLAGWKASENPSSPRVEDGAIVCEGRRAHLFYVGPDGQAEFENFELEVREHSAQPLRDLPVLVRVAQRAEGQVDGAIETAEGLAVDVTARNRVIRARNNDRYSHETPL